MVVRDLTEDEWNYERDHTNNGQTGYYCCPHCMESAHYDHHGEEPRAVTCAHCKAEFAAWTGYEPVSHSGKLPQAVED